MKFYELDGRTFEQGCTIPPLGFIDEDEASEEWPYGWYYQDEVEQSNGPYFCRIAAVLALEAYCKREGIT